MLKYESTNDQALIDELSSDISEDVMSMADIATNYVIAASPVDTGLFKGNWNVSIDHEYDGSFTHEDPSGDSTKSKMQSDIDTFNVLYDKTIYIQNNVKDLDDGEYEGYAAIVSFDKSERVANSIISGGAIRAVEGVK